MATSAQQLSQMEYGGGEFLTLSCGVLILERRWKLFPVGSQVVVCMGMIWGLKMSQKPATEKPQHVIDIEKCCVPGVSVIKAKQAGVPAYQSPLAIWHWCNPLQVKIIYCLPPWKLFTIPISVSTFTVVVQSCDELVSYKLSFLSPSPPTSS